MESSTDWAGVVGSIQARDGGGMEVLYTAMAGSVPAMMGMTGGSRSREDDLHEVLITVIEAIQQGTIREPARLMGFIRTVARRQAVAQIRSNIAHRSRFKDGAEIAPSRELSPEERFARTEHLESVLKRLQPRDREILLRFYLKEQSPERICLDMELTPTQFRLYKSRALSRCLKPRSVKGD